MRIKRHLSQGQVAEILNVRRTTISKYEKNECEPTITNLIKMIDLYCCDSNYILFENVPNEIRVKTENVILSKKYIH